VFGRVISLFSWAVIWAQEELDNNLEVSCRSPGLYVGGLDTQLALLLDDHSLPTYSER
jgi:hypothetical protein